MGRMRAGQLAPTDTAKALDAARACPDAWYRVQALASVAQHADQRIALRILEHRVDSIEDLQEIAGWADALAALNVRSRGRRQNTAAMIQGFVSRND